MYVYVYPVCVACQCVPCGYKDISMGVFLGLDQVSSSEPLSIFPWGRLLWTQTCCVQTTRPIQDKPLFSTLRTHVTIKHLTVTCKLIGNLYTHKSCSINCMMFSCLCSGSALLLLCKYLFNRFPSKSTPCLSRTVDK